MSPTAECASSQFVAQSENIKILADVGRLTLRCNSLLDRRDPSDSVWYVLESDETTEKLIVSWIVCSASMGIGSDVCVSSANIVVDKE